MKKGKKNTTTTAKQITAAKALHSNKNNDNNRNNDNSSRLNNNDNDNGSDLHGTETISSDTQLVIEINKPKSNILNISVNMSFFLCD